MLLHHCFSFCISTNAFRLRAIKPHTTKTNYRVVADRILCIKFFYAYTFPMHENVILISMVERLRHKKNVHWESRGNKKITQQKQCNSAAVIKRWLWGCSLGARVFCILKANMIMFQIFACRTDITHINTHWTRDAYKIHCWLKKTIFETLQHWLCVWMKCACILELFRVKSFE